MIKYMSGKVKQMTTKKTWLGGPMTKSKDSLVNPFFLLISM